MRTVLDIWRRIGTRLYLALFLAVALTLVSGAVGVFYFEQSGDLNHQAQSESVPALEASWAVAREAERLRSLGVELVAGSPSAAQSSGDAVAATLQRLESSLVAVNAVPSLSENAQVVSAAAYDVADIIDNLELARNSLAAANEDAAALEQRLATSASTVGESPAALSVLRQATQAEDEPALQRFLDEFVNLNALGIDRDVAELGGGEGVFFVRGQQLALDARIGELASSFDATGADLDGKVSALLDASSAHSSERLGLAVSSFDEGRTLLTAISVISMIIATLAAWVWVGNGMVRRLSRMSERMRGMAAGDLETPVPGVGRDEIGELADALEVFRAQALEVQRLNLVEMLYQELQETNDELKRTQARLVAQQKLAALGELVSGVAHEIRNPLNFVNNFSEGSLELYQELSEMLQNYRDKMSDADSALLDEISGELTNSLNRVLANGGRAMAIVERMRELGVVGGDPVPVDLNSLLRDSVQTGCSSFNAEWGDFFITPIFDLDESVGEVPLVERDFGEAIVSLVSNANYAMRLKRESEPKTYEPALTVSSRLVDNAVEVRVRDNGPGIAEDVLGHIFDPFFSTRDGASGAGLGLPIAADVARRLGGDLQVDTVHGEYAEFILTVPTAPATVPQP